MPELFQWTFPHLFLPTHSYGHVLDLTITNNGNTFNISFLSLWHLRHHIPFFYLTFYNSWAPTINLTRIYIPLMYSFYVLQFFYLLTLFPTYTEEPTLNFCANCLPAANLGSHLEKTQCWIKTIFLHVQNLPKGETTSMLTVFTLNIW